MSTYRNTCADCGDTTETDAWEPENCPFCEVRELTRAVAERDAEIARLTRAIEDDDLVPGPHYDELEKELAAERQRANALLSQSRLPEYLVRRIKHAIQKLSHPVAANPWTADLLNDILGAVGVRHE